MAVRIRFGRNFWPLAETFGRWPKRIKNNFFIRFGHWPKTETVGGIITEISGFESGLLDNLKLQNP
jgi:hypothetical protein